MNTSIYNIPNFNTFSVFGYSRFNISESESDICIFIKEYKDRIKKQHIREEKCEKSQFISFAENILRESNEEWLKDNYERFLRYSPNEKLYSIHFLSEMGFITCIIYSPDGTFTIVGHSTGLIQQPNQILNLINTQLVMDLLSYGLNKIKQVGPAVNMEYTSEILAEFAKNIKLYYDDTKAQYLWYPMFFNGSIDHRRKRAWVKENSARFLRNTPNEILTNRWFYTESGYISALVFSPNGHVLIVGHTSGLIQMRHGFSGTVLYTLRNIQFPPKPVYSLEFSRVEEKVCYAACMDGAIYRIEIPSINISNNEMTPLCIRVDPGLECLNMQFYGTPGISSFSTPFITQRPAALSLGLTADSARMVVGYADTSIKVYDMETQEAEATYKVHKLRLQFIPKKLQRMHIGQVCAVRCHDQNPYMFASAAWDNTLRIWDTRCKVGCVMTFEGVNVCSDSIDLNRDHCIAGSWQPTEALCVWDLVARKRLNVIRVQNRRPDVDGEYIYACRYWKSAQFNRKGKYAIIGGSGTKCVEVINLHNRYITCSYPAVGTVLALASFEERIAFGGTAPVFNIVTFHDPKHEKYEGPDPDDYDYTKSMSLFNDNNSDSLYSNDEVEQGKDTICVSTAN